MSNDYIGGTLQQPTLPPVLTLMPDDLIVIKLYVQYSHHFVGPGKLHLRQLKGKPLLDFLLSFVHLMPVVKQAQRFFNCEASVILAKVKNLVECNLYCSGKAVEKFWPGHSGPLIAALNIQPEYGPEDPERDMPYTCQRVIQDLSNASVEKIIYGALCIVYGKELKAAGLPEPELFEMCTKNKNRWLLRPEMIAYVQLNTPNFVINQYTTMLYWLCFARNQWVHRYERQVKHLILGYDSAIKACKAYGYGSSSICKYLFIAHRSLRAWVCWSDSDRKYGLGKLVAQNREIELHFQDIGVTSLDIIQKKKNVCESLELTRRAQLRKKVGGEFREYVCRVFKGEATDGFEFPKVGELTCDLVSTKVGGKEEVKGSNSKRKWADTISEAGNEPLADISRQLNREILRTCQSKDKENNKRSMEKIGSEDDDQIPEYLEGTDSGRKFKKHKSSEQGKAKLPLERKSSEKADNELAQIPQPAMLVSQPDVMDTVLSSEHSGPGIIDEDSCSSAVDIVDINNPTPSSADRSHHETSVDSEQLTSSVACLGQEHEAETPSIVLPSQTMVAMVTFANLPIEMVQKILELCSGIKDVVAFVSTSKLANIAFSLETEEEQSTNPTAGSVENGDTASLATPKRANTNTIADPSTLMTQLVGGPGQMSEVEEDVEPLSREANRAYQCQKNRPARR